MSIIPLTSQLPNLITLIASIRHIFPRPQKCFLLINAINPLFIVPIHRAPQLFLFKHVLYTNHATILRVEKEKES